MATHEPIKDTHLNVLLTPTPNSPPIQILNVMDMRPLELMFPIANQGGGGGAGKAHLEPVLLSILKSQTDSFLRYFNGNHIVKIEIQVLGSTQHFVAQTAIAPQTHIIETYLLEDCLVSRVYKTNWLTPLNVQEHYFSPAVMQQLYVPSVPQILTITPPPIQIQLPDISIDIPELTVVQTTGTSPQSIPVEMVSLALTIPPFPVGNTTVGPLSVVADPLPFSVLIPSLNSANPPTQITFTPPPFVINIPMFWSGDLTIGPLSFIATPPPCTALIPPFTPSATGPTTTVPISIISHPPLFTATPPSFAVTIPPTTTSPPLSGLSYDMIEITARKLTITNPLSNTVYKLQ